LEDDFTKEEILRAINDSYAKGALGLDGFSFLFYQNFWSIIKKDLMTVVKGFQKWEANLAWLNYAKIILIPKEEGANTLKKIDQSV
jgi:hypothetical protein